MKSISIKISSLLILILIAVSCFEFEEDTSPSPRIEGSWAQQTQTSEGTETLVFNFNEGNSFTSSTETCKDTECIIETGPGATWSIEGKVITVRFEGINVSKTYTVLEDSDSTLILQEGTNTLTFSRI